VSDRALIVFLKYPEPGAVKTRLASALGAETAAALYRVLAEEVLELTVPRAGEYETLVYFDPPGAAEAMRAWLPGLRLRPQCTGDLGVRMATAFAQAFERGARRAAIIGTDAPAVTRETVAGALGALDEANVVVGPAEDGGYYLLALDAPHRELFENVAWSTSTVLEETRARAAAAGLRVRELNRLGDIDTLEDVRAEWPRIRPLLEGQPDLRRRLEAILALPWPAPREDRMAEVRTYLETLTALDETPLAVAPGGVIFSAGDAGREMYVVRTGSVDLKIGDTLLESVGPGGILGELALVDPAPRSASAVAGPDCTLVRVDQEAFDDLVRRVPGLALEVMRVMARRLRKTNPT
jgi:rSAM/selenodomain-associated transferase 1